MKKILITGANGYIGSHICRSFDSKYATQAYSMRQLGIPNTLAGIDSIIHLSALVHQQENKPEQDYFTINTEQTLALAKKAKADGVKHFIFFSSIAVFGLNGFLNKELHPKLNETSPCKPRTAYGKSKLKAEKLLQELDSDNFTVSIIRPPIVYGYQCPGNMMKLKKLIQLLRVLPLGNNTNQRSMVNIDNLVAFTKQVIEKKTPGIFIPQDDELLSIKAISQAIANGLGKKTLFIPLPRWGLKLLHGIKPQIIESLFGHLVFDSTTSNKTIGYSSRKSSLEALQEL